MAQRRFALLDGTARYVGSPLAHPGSDSQVCHADVHRRPAPVPGGRRQGSRGHGAGSTVTAPVVAVAVMTRGDAVLFGTVTRTLPTVVLAWTA
jgi:hypothetical protein